MRLICLLALVLIAPGAALSQQPAQAPPPAQAQELLRLLDDPVLRDWIADQRRGAGAPPAPAVNEAEPPATAAMMANRLALLRGHLAEIAAAAPSLPAEIAGAIGRLRADISTHGLPGVGLIVAAFIALGAGLEALARIPLGKVRPRLAAAAGPRQRLAALGLRIGVDLVLLAIFAGGSIGAFLAFDWPPLLRHVALAFLGAAIAFRLMLALVRAALAPGAGEAERALPLTDDAAGFWYRRLALLAGWFILGVATIDALRGLAIAQPASQLAAYALGLILLAIAIVTIWTRPGRAGEQGARGHRLQSALVTLLVVLIWGLWVAGLSGLFWLAVVVLLLPLAIRVGDRAARHLSRPVDGAGQETTGGDLAGIFLGRGLRVLLLVGATLLVARGFGIDLAAMSTSDTLVVRLLRGALNGVIILLVADLLWQVARTLIDRRLAAIDAAAAPGSDEALRQARIRTLLPILRYVVVAVLATIAGLMVLAALGVEIGPLIAGAGVVGIAVGFGAQTLVKDIISGVFYLLDDAFRVGEYIQSGNYKGTVEALGFRSLKLRHHRGPIYTVPYGSLGAVENLSRDWMIDKITIGVDYGTDLELARRLIKQVGRELAADPEFAADIIEPLKMQGVEQFGDYAIELRLKMMTKPGKQFTVRRKALARLKTVFDENGIVFARPTVTVASPHEPHAEPPPQAAAQAAARLVLPQSAG